MSSIGLAVSLWCLATQSSGGSEWAPATTTGYGCVLHPWQAPTEVHTPRSLPPRPGTIPGTPAHSSCEAHRRAASPIEHGAPRSGAESGLAIQIDASSGEETILDLGTSRQLQDQWTRGRPKEVTVDERSLDPSWGDPTLITSTSFPWSAACRIEYTDPSSGLTYLGSGTLIDAKCVITAGSVVHQGNGGTWNQNIKVFPAWDGDADAFGEAGQAYMATFTGWTVNGNLGDCMGFIRLDRPLGFLTGWMGYGYDTDDSFYLNTGFNAAGYPGSSSCYPGAPDQLYYAFGAYDTVNPTTLHAQARWSCSSSGMEGMGAYSINGSNRYVHGTHVFRCTKCNPDIITDCRMTAGKYGFLDGSFLPWGYPTTVPDYVALDVNAPSANPVVTSGDTLDDFDYLVANSSLYDPFGAQTFNVDVYLSTDDTISAGDTVIQSHQFLWDPDPRTSIRVTSPVVVPTNTPSGNYWIGVIVSGPGDPSNANDATSGWDAVPLTIESCQIVFNPIGQGLAGSGQFVPLLFGSGSACQSGQHAVTIAGGLGGARGFLWLGFGQVDLFPFFGGHFYIDLSPPRFVFPVTLQGAVGAPGAGYLNLPGNDKAGFQGLTFYMQGTFFDPGAVKGVSMTNALEFIIDE